MGHKTARDFICDNHGGRPFFGGEKPKKLFTEKSKDEPGGQFVGLPVPVEIYDLGTGDGTPTSRSNEVLPPKEVLIERKEFKEKRFKRLRSTCNDVASKILEEHWQHFLLLLRLQLVSRLKFKDCLRLKREESSR